MSFDPSAATAAYIESLGAEALAKAAAYTTGGHWLLLWNLLATAIVTWVVVRTGVLDRINAKLARRGLNVKAWVVAAVYIVVSGLISLPWTIYTDWWRERGYGRTSQPLIDYLGQGLLSLLIAAVFVALFFVGVYALIRRAGRFWWVWSGGLTAFALALLLLAGPVFIDPLFNDYKPVPAGEVRDALVAMAKQAGVPEDRIFVYDGSRQSNNFTANVSGIAGSARIAISDVAFKGASLDEVKAVTGHEIGHYVLGHVWRTVLLLVQPIVNGQIRRGENEADQYSLETENLPDAMASALVKTAEYRNPRPGRLEEVLFYTHPSVERRVRRAMDWKASHPPT